MYLARVQFSRERGFRLGLRNPYEWHTFSWACYPGAPDASRDFLTRLDLTADRCALYVLGRREPVCPERCAPGEWACRPVAPSFLNHPLYRFDVRVNPTRKVRVDTPDGGHTKNGRREALLSPQAQREWLARKATDGGFELEGEVQIHPAESHYFMGRQGQGLHVGVRFSGLLRVTDPALFVKTYEKGLGSAKAFGFGLLLLQPVFA